MKFATSFLATTAPTFLQRSGLREPFLALAQPRQRRARQRIERSSAGTAFVTLQPVRVAVTNDVAAQASRTSRQRFQTPLDNHRDRLFAAPCRQVQRQLRSLLATKRIDQAKQPPETVCIHLDPQCPPPRRAMGRVCTHPRLRSRARHQRTRTEPMRIFR